MRLFIYGKFSVNAKLLPILIGTQLDDRRCAASQNPVIVAPISRTAYGQTPREAAARFRDSLKAQSKEIDPCHAKPPETPREPARSISVQMAAGRANTHLAAILAPVSRFGAASTAKRRRKSRKSSKKH